ncbi:hypothetical protein QJV45_00520 [Listeria booriae]|uniref:hypothetical protein n=1 Tax=Listeria booriae TaxID=1552123 RepID=UPI0028800F43|nr:hypothetical protein [Listeria booriae]MDT0108921.1 hypothetical protein [Listeria booriae]
MSILKNIFGGINKKNAIIKYGTVDDWKKASPSQLNEYRKNIEMGIDNGQLTSPMLGRFLIVVGDSEQGEEILYQAIQDDIEGANGDYVDTISYYYMKKGKYNSSAKNDKWFDRWIKAGEKCVENGEENAEVRLADIYKSCYNIADPEFDKIVSRITTLYQVAVKKHQRKGALNYGLFILDKIGTEEFKLINPKQYRNWEDAEPYLMQALKDEKSTKYREYAYESICWFYLEYIKRALDTSIQYYFEQKNLDGLSSIILKNKKNVLDNIKYCGEMLPSIESSLNNYVIHFEFLLIADKLRKIDDYEIICDCYARQINKKLFTNISNQIDKEKCIDEITKFFLKNQEQFTTNGTDYSTAFYEFINRRNIIVEP